MIKGTVPRGQRTYPSARLIVVKVHELTPMAECARLLGILSLPNVNEILSKPDTVKKVRLVNITK